jgi:hypothetical protein
MVKTNENSYGVEMEPSGKAFGPREVLKSHERVGVLNKRRPA